MKAKLIRLMAFVEWYHKGFNEEAFALGVGEEFKSIGKKAYERVKEYWDKLNDSDKKEVADKFPDYFYGSMSKTMGIQRVMFYVE